MENYSVTPGSPLRGELVVPGDKSITHRALILSALASGESTIEGGLDSEDTQRTVEILKCLGVDIDQSQSPIWRIRSPGLQGFRPPTKELDAGNSGTTCRLLLGILAAQKFQSRITGDSSLSKRPMNRVLIPLQRMGARFESDNGYLPITIFPVPENGLRPINYESPVASAQVKSACMLAGLYAHGVTSISESQLSRDHTERMLSALIPVNSRMVTEQSSLAKARVVHKIEFAGPVQSLPPMAYKIPGDFSSAAFFLAAASLVAQSEIQIRFVGINPTRTGFLELLKKMGGNISWEDEQILQGEPVADLKVLANPLNSSHVHGEKTLRAIDEIPIWTILAAQANGTSVLSDAGELRVKESDRLESMSENLKRLGVRVESKNDGLVIEGKNGAFLHPEESGYGPGYLESFGDHRVAMALAVASLLARSSLKSKTKLKPVVIQDTACVKTSFPQFFEILLRLQNMKNGTRKL